MLLALAWVGAVPMAAAQADDRPAGAGRLARLTRLAEALTDGSRPVRPLVGIVVPGSGPAAGAAVDLMAGERGAWGVGAEGMISTRNYQHLLVRGGRMARRRFLPELRAADTAAMSFMDPGRGETGAAVFLEHRYRHLPRMPFFGVENDALLRTDFGMDRTTTDLVGQWAPAPRFGVAGRVGVITTTLFDGTDKRRPNTHDRFGPVLDDVRFARSRYLTGGVGVSIRGGDVTAQSAGWLVHAAATGFGGTSAGASSFARLAVDARGYRPVGWAAHVLALRLLASTDVIESGGQVPYYLQQTLGGTNTVRALDSYRLRGTQLAQVTLESRWRVTRRLEIAPFVDGGRARGGALQMTQGWVVTPGIGARLRFKQAVVGRLDVAHRGGEGWRVSYAFDNPF